MIRNQIRVTARGAEGGISGVMMFYIREKKNCGKWVCISGVGRARRGRNARIAERFQEHEEFEEGGI